MVNDGTPASFIGIRPETGEQVFCIPLEIVDEKGKTRKSNGAWGVFVHSSGDCYVAAYGEALIYRWDVNDEKLELIGPPAGGSTLPLVMTEDENGIIWPKSIAPYHVVVVPISAKDETQMAIAEQLYADLQKRGVEVMLDDRNERPGVKFKDADLIGYPVRITVGKKSAEEGTVEYKLRTEAENEVVALSEVVEKTVAYIFS